MRFETEVNENLLGYGAGPAPHASQAPQVGARSTLLRGTRIPLSFSKDEETTMSVR